MDRYLHACRICMKELDGIKQIPIFEHGLYNNRRVGEKMRDCLNIDVYQADPLSKYICTRCYFKLELASEMKQERYRSNAIFVHHLRPVHDRPQAHMTPLSQRQLVPRKMDIALMLFERNLDLCAYYFFEDTLRLVSPTKYIVLESFGKDFLEFVRNKVAVQVVKAGAKGHVGFILNYLNTAHGKLVLQEAMEPLPKQDSFYSFQGLGIDTRIKFPNAAFNNFDPHGKILTQFEEALLELISMVEPHQRVNKVFILTKTVLVENFTTMVESKFNSGTCMVALSAAMPAAETEGRALEVSSIVENSVSWIMDNYYQKAAKHEPNEVTEEAEDEADEQREAQAAEEAD